MESAATYYISKATPRENPVVFSERTKGNIKRVHGISGKAFEVTSKTTKLIHENIDRMIGVIGRKKATTQKPPLPSRPDEKSGLPSSYPGTPTPTPGTSTPPPSSKEKPRFINRLLISTDLLLTTLEKSGKGLLDSGTQNIARSLSHKYGQDTGNATMMIGGTFQNVGAVYIDARGIGRRALLQRAGKNVVKGVIGGKQVVFGAEAQATAQSQAQGGLGSGSNPSASPMAPSPISTVDNKPPLPPRKLSPAPPPYATYSKEKRS
jgi:spartin